MVRLWMKVFLTALLVAGCAESEEQAEFQVYQNAYGFSLRYPGDWIPVTADEPDRWAILDSGDNAILVMVTNASSEDLAVLGLQQAIIDHYPQEIALADLQNSVRIISHGDRNWYTYGIKFNDKGIDSIVSGTVCGVKEIKAVLVSSDFLYEQNRDTYLEILASLTC